MKRPEQMKKGTLRFAEELSKINPETGGPRNPAIPLANDRIPRMKIQDKNINPNCLPKAILSS